MATHPRGNSKIKSISIEQTLYQKAVQRAEGLDLTFSKYIQKLIKKDLEKREDMVFKETPPPWPAPKTENRLH
jgi:predicted DNA-binding protein